MLQDISSQAEEQWYTEESLAVNSGPAAAGLCQQSYTQRLWVCVKRVLDTSNRLSDLTGFEFAIKDYVMWHLKLQVTVHITA